MKVNARIKHHTITEDVDFTPAQSENLNQLSKYDLLPSEIGLNTFRKKAYANFNGEIKPLNSEDGKAILKDEDGNILDEKTVQAGEEVDIIAPNGTVVVKYEDDTPIETVSVLSGGNEEVVVPKVNTDDWVRPSSWRPIPTIGEAESVLYILFAVFPNGLNQLALNVGCNRIDVIDDTGVLTTLTSGFDNLIFDYNSITSDIFRGYKQIWLKCYYTTSTQVNGVRTDYPHATYGNNLGTGILEVVISNLGTNAILFGNTATAQKNMMLEHIYFRSLNAGTSLGSLARGLKSIRKISLPAGTYDVYNTASMFYDCSLMKMPNDVVFTSSYACDSMFYLSVIDEARHDFSVIPTIASDNIFSNFQGRKIHATNMVSLTFNLNLQGCQTVKEVIFEGYARGHNLTQVGIFGVDAFTAWVDSLGNASGSQNITVSLTQFNSFGGVGSYVATELTNKGYTLVY